MNSTRTHSIDSNLNPLGPFALTALALVLAACQASSGTTPRPGAAPTAGPGATLDGHDPLVGDWNAALFDRFVAAEKYQHPFRALRVLNMLHIAQHDALAAIRPSYAPYALNERAPDADPIAAAASAAFEVLAPELPGERAALEELLGRQLAALPQGGAREKGLALGKRAAAAIRARRANDGSHADPVVPMRLEGPQRPGQYRPIPPVDYVYAPGWRDLTPFGLQNAQQFRPAPPPALDSETYTRDFEEVKARGMKGSTVRSPEETAYGSFWYELSDIGWNRIGRVVASERKLGLQASARMFALLNMALMDAYVAGWDAKIHYSFWRPTTAIRAADIDGNPATAPDTSWESAEVTPPVEDYVSTHSALGDAGAEVLAHVFGDATPFGFTSTTGVPADTVRRFPSFSVAADENADSRVQTGLHFRFSCKAGQALGRQVGAWVVASALRPLPLVATSR